ncbi:MAG: hypothetical protein KBG54_06965, partial [Oscillospiraceae bacterium]|nr:hypothetical protein [Oscillospiraceae bacterium]
MAYIRESGVGVRWAISSPPAQRKANYKAMQKYNFFQKMIDANNAFAESQKSPQLEQIGAYY